MSKKWFTYLEHATTEKDHRGKADNVLNIYSTNRHLIQLVQGYFLAVQDSSIGDLVTHSLTH